MRILLDVDGVLADWHGHLVKLANSRFGTSLSPDVVTEWEAVPVLTKAILDSVRANPRPVFWDEDDEPIIPGPLNVRTVLEHMAYADNYFYQTLPAFAYSQLAVETLRLTGHDVYFVTSPILTMPKWTHIRSEWLKRHFGAKESEMVFTKSKHLIRGDVLVEDKFENIESWAAENKLHHQTYLVARPYNVQHQKSWVRTIEDLRPLLDL